MKLSESMKREFEKMVSARMTELLAEQVEQVAQARVAALVNGRARKAHTKAPHVIAYPPGTVLRRGDKAGLGRFRMTEQSGLMVNAAWEALARDGHFASMATRADMTAYLLKTFEGATPKQVSAALSVAIQRGVLAAEAPRA